MTNDQGPPHPYLQEPILYVHGLVNGITDGDLADALADCLKIRPEVKRDSSASIYAPVTGRILFQEKSNAEKAYATVQDHSFPAYKCQMKLSINPSPGSDKPPSANVQPLLVKNLPDTMSSAYLYQVFRPYGPIYKVTLNYYDPYPGSGIPPKFSGEGVVQFYEIGHARTAMAELHCSEIGSTMITVNEYSSIVPKSSGQKWAEAAPFVPGSGYYGSSALSSGWRSPAPSEMLRMASPMPQWPVDLPASSSVLSLQQQAQQRQEHESRGKIAPVIDPCNLFIKNLSPFITSQDLYTHFSPFGQIISARVMKDEHTNVSREFGFVSFEKDYQAAEALKAMDGKKIHSVSQPDPGRNIIVRLHEPKKSREPRLKQIHAQKDSKKSGDMSPTESTTSPYPSSTPISPQQPTHSDVTSVESPPVDMLASTSSTTSFQLVSPAPTTPTTPAVQEAPVSPSPVVAVSAPSPVPVSVPQTGTERERLRAAISQLTPDQVDDLTDMICSLSKKERAMCLFNPTFLNTKVKEAQAVLELADEEEEATPAPTSTPAPKSMKTSLPTPAATPSKQESPKVKAPTITHTLQSLSLLPCEQIWELVLNNDPSIPPGLLKRPSASDLAKGEEIVGSMPVKEGLQKSLVGNHIFKYLKSEAVSDPTLGGTKNASKIMVALLKNEVPVAICRVFYAYPEIVMEKVRNVYRSEKF